VLSHEWAELGDFAAAWQALIDCRRALDAVADRQSVGLGRHYVAEQFLLAGTASGELAATVFAEADRQADDVSWLPLVTLRAAVNIGDHLAPHSAITPMPSTPR
jgi:hypothetical protein